MASSVDAKLLKATKFPPEFNQKVDMKKVNIEVMKKWIAGRISEILGNDDDVVIELCYNLLEGNRFPEIKVLQIQLTGFLDKDTAKFCKELWLLCLSAQSNPQGVPKELLEAKKLELIQEKIDAEKAAEEARKKQEAERTRDNHMDSLRQRERGDRGRGRGRGRGGRGDYGDYRPPRHDRSPPPRWSRDSPGRSPPRRDTDSYVPRGRGPREDGRRRYSPPSRRVASISRSRSRSRTPPRRRRYSPSRSPSPPPRDDRSRRDRRSPPRRPRSYTPSISRSPSPRRTDSSRYAPSSRKHRSSHNGHRRRRYPSTSLSRSPPARPRRRSLSSASAPTLSPPRHRRPRSPTPPPRRRRNTSSMSRSRSRSRSPLRERAKKADRRESLSKSPARKRHRSVERYAPRRGKRSESGSERGVSKRQRTVEPEVREKGREKAEEVSLGS